MENSVPEIHRDMTQIYTLHVKAADDLLCFSDKGTKDEVGQGEGGERPTNMPISVATTEENKNK